MSFSVDELRRLQKERTVRLLDHPRNSRVRTNFTSDCHDYYVDGVKVTGLDGWCSVTSLNKKFWPPFDLAKVVRENVRKANDPQNAGRLSEAMRKYQGKTVEDVHREFDEKREYGTEKHAAIEAFLRGEQNELSLQAPLGFYRFLVENPHLEAIAVEMPLFDEELMCLGTDDVIFRNRLTGELHVGDWKNCADSLHKKRGGTGTHPLTVHMAHTRASEYGMQLNLYGLMLDRKYSLEQVWGAKLANEFLLINFPPNRPGEYELVRVPRRDLGELAAHLPWNDRDPWHCQFAATLGQPLINPIPAPAKADVVLTVVAAGPLPPDVVWTHGPYTREQRNGRGRYQLPDSIWKHPWGYHAKDVPRERALAFYESWLLSSRELLGQLHMLYNKTLLCWCRNECTCHTSILRRYAEATRGRPLDLPPPPPPPPLRPLSPIPPLSPPHSD